MAKITLLTGQTHAAYDDGFDDVPPYLDLHHDLARIEAELEAADREADAILAKGERDAVIAGLACAALLVGIGRAAKMIRGKR